MSSVTIVTLSIVSVIHPSYHIATYISGDLIAVNVLLITTAGSKSQGLLGEFCVGGLGMTKFCTRV